MLYNIISRMIEHKNTDGLAKKIDVFYLGNRLTEEEYTQLIAMLNN